MAYYEMTENQLRYDVYPLVVTEKKETLIHIRPLGSEKEFNIGTSYDVTIAAMDLADPKNFPASGDYKHLTVVFKESGFEITHTFQSEQEYCIAIGVGEKIINSFSVYCVSADLAERYPFIGDLHVHTNLSDGSEIPEVVCANYRKYGYDFMTISDHNRYYPSLRALNFYKDVPIELNIVPGEEVHMPAVYGKTNDVHIVNFGGEYSINSLVEDIAVSEVGKDISVRATRKNDVPDVMTMKEYSDKMIALADKTHVPDGVDAMPVAVCNWAFDEIRKANGLGIFAHPNWRRGLSYHVPEKLTDFMMEQRNFDAFEVLGGESYYEQNGFQTVRYYEQVAKGNRFPIVGSTDTHSSSPHNKNGFICSTMVFAEKNEKNSIIKAIKDYYSIAVDTISPQFRLVGESRFIRYGCFLLKNYFPLHDELCFEEGRLMKQYAVGTAEEKQEALDVLHIINGRVKKHRHKYFDLRQKEDKTQPKTADTAAVSE